MIKTSSDLHRKSLVVFGGFGKMFGNIRVAFENFWTFGNLRKVVKYRGDFIWRRLV